MTTVTPAPGRRIDYAGSVHDEREIDAVVEVLRGGPTALRIGKNVRAMETPRGRAVRQATGRHVQLRVARRSTSRSRCSASSRATRSSPRRSRSRPTSRRWSAPASSRPSSTSRPTRSRSTSTRIEEMIGPRTRAILAPNLIGNAPDWDVIRAIADRHGLTVVEDSCDALGLTLRGTPTGTRADISLTSFALSHIITAAGTGGMVCFDDDALADRALLLRRWGRRSEVQLFGSTQGRRAALLLDDRRRPRVRQPVHLRRGRLELRAVRAVGRVRARAARQAGRQPRPPPAQLRAHRRPLRPLAATCSPCPGSPTASRPAGTCSRSSSTPSRGIRRAEFQQWMEAHGDRHPHGLDRQRRPPARVPRQAPPPARRRAAERRPGHGVGPRPAQQPLDDRRRLRLHRRVPRGLRRSAADWPDGAAASPVVGPSSPAPAAASAPPSPSGSPPRAPTSPSPPAPSTSHDHLAGSLDETAERIAGLRRPAWPSSWPTSPTRRTGPASCPRPSPALGGPIDILVNNAAAAIYRRPVLTSRCRRRRILFEVNVHAPARPRPGGRSRRWSRPARAGSSTSRSGTARHWDGPPFELGPQGIDHRHLRRVEGGAQPDDQRTRRRARTAPASGSTPSSRAPPS